MFGLARLTKSIGDTYSSQSPKKHIYTAISITGIIVGGSGVAFGIICLLGNIKVSIPGINSIYQHLGDAGNSIISIVFILSGVVLLSGGGYIIACANWRRKNQLLASNSDKDTIVKNQKEIKDTFYTTTDVKEFIKIVVQKNLGTRIKIGSALPCPAHSNQYINSEFISIHFPKENYVTEENITYKGYLFSSGGDNPYSNKIILQRLKDLGFTESRDTD